MSIDWAADKFPDLLRNSHISFRRNVLYCKSIYNAKNPQSKKPTLTQSSDEHISTLIKKKPRSWISIIKKLSERFVLTPFIVVLRAVYLAFVFVPVIVVYPVGWFGSVIDDNSGGETTGRKWWYSFLANQMQRAGPTFIKLAQWAASRSDLFSKEFCSQLGKLHSKNRPHDFKYSLEAIEAAIDPISPGELFEWIEEEPLGAGAIAQVHRAMIRVDSLSTFLKQKNAETQLFNDEEIDKVIADGKKNPQVAIKVLHPHVEFMIDYDLKIMSLFAKLLNAIPSLKWFSFPEEVEMFGDLMKSQINLLNETENLRKFTKNFKDRPKIQFPQPIRPLCKDYVLFETYESAVPLGTLFSNSGSSFDKQAAGIGLDGFLRMIINDNFIHADLHPGNILVSFVSPPPLLSSLDRMLSRYFDTSQFGPYMRYPMDPPEFPTSDEVHNHIRELSNDPKGLKEYLSQLSVWGFTADLVFLDCGLATTLEPNDRRNFLDLFEAICTFDGLKAGKLMVERCRTPNLVIDPEIFALRIQDIVLGVRDLSFKLSKLTIGSILSKTMMAVRKHHVKLEPDFVNVIMAIFVLEGIGRQLDPNLDILKAALPILRDWWKEEAKNQIRHKTSLSKRQRQKDESAENDASQDLETIRPPNKFDLLAIWFYVEMRQYIEYIHNWGYDDEPYFGPFSPFMNSTD
ncbi:hypothetical protein H4219_005441 [Mycoemilia scoparia]|uniref:ABC1 atypical kinase-like domain-containing protein n=1 Tax=Mycoemilia scoparia TaxID=417184 RepID=A0A9W7ZW40_9FUNG|nr:hypothetical protein H4219_005441 [Mycoemilia scoparia]